MNALRAAWRLGRVLLHALAGFATVVVLFPRWDLPRREAKVQAWSGKMLAVMGVRIEVHGGPPNAPVLLVANHISWLDILVLHAARYCRFVSKADVRRWPLVGAMATGAGTIYIERDSRRDAMRVVHRISDSLRRGEVVAVFPEGTTNEHAELLPFHGNLIQGAISAGTPAQPVALSFIDSATRTVNRGPCYTSQDTLLSSAWRTLAGPSITAVVRYGSPQSAQGRDRRAWAVDLRLAVDELRRQG
jgi:1-acyl-sn-glycerol-3-phosphate acyltransferase